MRPVLPYPPLPAAERVGVSTISFRHRPLEEALRLIAATGATRIDLGAIPAVTDHVSVPFTGDAAAVARQVAEAGLHADAINADPGDLNDPALDESALERTITSLADLAAACGGALIVPAGAATWNPFASHEEDMALIADRLRRISALCADRGVRLLVEALHHQRYVHTTAMADELLAACGPEVLGLLLDVSHVVASDEDPVAWLGRCADRVERVHLRDAVPGNLNLSLGAGSLDLPALITALEAHVPGVRCILELETHDVQEEERPADVDRSVRLVLDLIGA